MQVLHNQQRYMHDQREQHKHAVQYSSYLTNSKEPAFQTLIMASDPELHT